jgi:predicted dehydrogenase
MGINALIIGFGSIGQRHFEILNRISSVENIEIVTRQSITDYPTQRDLYSINELQYFDYFIICSETHKHFKQLEYLEHNVNGKIILVEKPLFAECQGLSVSNNQILVGYNLRFDPIIRMLRKWLAEEKTLSANIITGQYLPDWRSDRDYRLSYSASKEKGGGVLLDLSHEIDYTQWLFGRYKHLEAINEKISNLEITSDDYLALIGKTVNGCMITMTLDCISKIPQRKMTIHTTNYTILADLITGRLLRQAKDNKSEEVLFNRSERNESYEAMHGSILDNQASDVCTLAEGYMTMEIIEKIRQSSKKKGWNGV